MVCDALPVSDAIVQGAVLLLVPAVSVTVLLQVIGVPGAGTLSVKLTVPPAGTTGPLAPIVATKVIGLPYVDGLELPVWKPTVTVGVALLTVSGSALDTLFVL